MSLFLYFLLFLAFHGVFNQLQRRVRNYPPTLFPSLPFIGHLYLLRKPLHRTLSAISSRCGPILYLHFGSRPVLLVSSPSAAEECLGDNDVVFANRPRLLAGKYMGYNYTTLAWAPYGNHWRNLRRISSLQLLSSANLQTLSHIRADEVRSLILWLSQYPGQMVDMRSALFGLLLNIITRMIGGSRYYGEEVADMEKAGRFKSIIEESFLLQSVSNVSDFLPYLGWFASRRMEKKLQALQKKRDSFMQSLIEERRRLRPSSEEKKNTMIDVLLSMQESEPEYYTDRIIIGLMMVLLAAGTDTSVGTLEWAMSFLLNNPEILKKTTAEIDDRVGQERLINESDFPNLPYLHCVIKETLRITPPGPLLPHESSADCTVGGFKVPRGTLLMVNVWAIQNDPKNWEDPTRFDPDRFVGSEGLRDGFKFMPFGSGRRACPGEGLAMRVVGLALGSLVQCFEWERASNEMVDLREGNGLTMPKAIPLKAKCHPRPIMLKLLSNK